MFQIQDMFENGKTDIVLKTAKRFNVKKPYHNAGPETGYRIHIIKTSSRIFFVSWNTPHIQG